MKKLAGFTLLTKASQPMFAYHVVEVPCIIGIGGMLIRAITTERAVSLKICFTRRPIRRNTHAEVIKQKGRE